MFFVVFVISFKLNVFCNILSMLGEINLGVFGLMWIFWILRLNSLSKMVIVFCLNYDSIIFIGNLFILYWKVLVNVVVIFIVEMELLYCFKLM